MTSTQKELFKLFKEVAEICHRHNIVYYMAGGTLIGVLRHGGFIPWDDDLDIMMTKKNWLKFVEVCKDEIPDNRVLECQELNRDYPNVIGRYTDTSTTSIHENEVLGDGSPGYVIDIIPLDPVPDLEAYKKYADDLLLYSDLVNPTTQYSYRLSINKDRYFEYLERMDKEGKDAVLKELEDQLFSYDEDECDYLVLRWGGVPFLFDKTLYGESRWGYFEGFKCRIPDRSSDYLVQHFGDEWTTIPPHDEQELHNAVFSLDIDFKTMQKDYMHFLDEDTVRKNWMDRKRFYFRRMEDRYKAHYQKSKAIAEMYSMEINARIKGNETVLKELLAKSEFDVLQLFFKDYINNQNLRNMIGREDFGGYQRYNNPVFIDIDDDMFNIIILTLINTHRISKADRFLAVREIVKGELSEDLKKSKDLIAQFRNIISLHDLGHLDESIAQAEKMYAENSRMKSLEMFLASAYIEAKMFDKAKTVLDTCLSRYPEDGYFKKYYGDYLRLNNNDLEAAKKLYNEALESTDNGIVLYEIERILNEANV